MSHWPICPNHSPLRSTLEFSRGTPQHESFSRSVPCSTRNPNTNIFKASTQTNRQRPPPPATKSSAKRERERDGNPQRELSSITPSSHPSPDPLLFSLSPKFVHGYRVGGRGAARPTQREQRRIDPPGDLLLLVLLVVFFFSSIC